MSFRNYYDSTSYGRSRESSRIGLDRPTTVTAKYSSTPSYKSSSIPILCNERPTKEDTPISTIANRYASYKTEKPATKYEKKDYSKLTVPSVTVNKSRDVSPVSTSSKYSISRPSRHLSPERRSTKSYKAKSRDPSPTDRDKNIPSKTDKSTGYNSLSSYKLYPRSSSYTRPASRTDVKPEITVNRYAIANRLSTNYLRSPPTVKRTSVSPVSLVESPKSEIEKSVSPLSTTEGSGILRNGSCSPLKETQLNIPECAAIDEENENETETETVSVVTRHTSPTPPGSSAYVRSRRADMAKTIEKLSTRMKKRPEMVDKEVQSDRLDDTTRSGRFASTARASVPNFSIYPPTITSYTGYAGRYATQYSNLRESSVCNSYTDRSRSHSTEPQPKDLSSSCSPSDYKEKEKSVSKSSEVDLNQDLAPVYEENNDKDTSEVIINVNLKLAKAKSPFAVASAELVSPEITISNSQLPPQAPKPEGTAKPKKLKARKSSTDSSSDSSSKKKVVKRRSKSVSSTDSDPGSETSEKVKENKSTSSVKKSQKSLSSSHLTNGHSKTKNNKRESSSPDSITQSTQSVSEDESVSKSKTNDFSRTSADELSIPTDRSPKQGSPVNSHKNENGTEEAKSFLIRALAPVTNLFKIRQQDSSDNSRWLETSTSESTGKDVSNLVTESDKSCKSKSNTDNIIPSNDDNVVKLKAIRHIESGERAWWMDSNSANASTENKSSDQNLPKKIKQVDSGERAWWLENQSEHKSDSYEPAPNNNTVSDSTDASKPLRKCLNSEEEKPWWLDSNANIPEGIEQLTPPRKSSSESENSEKFNFFKVRHIESGEQKDWWLTSNENSASTKPDGQNSLSKTSSDQKSFPLRRIRHVESGERPWWLASDKNIPEGVEKLPTPPPKQDSDSSDSEEVQEYVPPAAIPPFPLQLPDDEPLGDRRSPEGLETPKENEEYRGRRSPYENNRQYGRRGSTNLYLKMPERYISRYSDIDDILGTSGHIYTPFMDSILARRMGQMPYDDDECEEIDPTQVRIHDSTAQRPVIKKLPSRSDIVDYSDEPQLDDATLQVFKDGEYGPYLDLDSSLAEQDEELEGLHDRQIIVHQTKPTCTYRANLVTKLGTMDGNPFTRCKDTSEGACGSAESDTSDQELDGSRVYSGDDMAGFEKLLLVNLDNRKNAFLLRTQVSVRVHTVIDKLLHSQGRELRHALFTLKQILQSDNELVHEFVANKGLDCLMQVSNMADQNYLDYILRALGQILLYVDGMHGVMAHKRCVQWLYSLISSKYRHVVKTALKLLLVFVEYTDKNCLLLIDAIHAVDTASGRQPWYNVMKILQDFDVSDTELLIYAITIINRCLNNVPDRDTYYDQVDALQDQGMDDIIQLYMSKQGTDLDLLRQLQIFESVLLYEDGDETGTALKQLDDSVISSVRRRSINLNTSERRKSKKQQIKEKDVITVPVTVLPDTEIKSNPRSLILPTIENSKENKELSTALRRRRDRYARQAHHIIQQQELLSYNGLYCNSNGNHTNMNKDDRTNGFTTRMTNGNRNINGNKHGTSHCITINSHQESEDTFVNETTKNQIADVLRNGAQKYTSGLKQRLQNGTLGHVTAVDTIAVIRQKQMETPTETKDDRGILLNREHSIKDLAQRLTSPVSPTTEDKPLRVADMAGIVSKAKEELAKSQSKEVIKSPTIEKVPKLHEIKVSENDLHWKELKKGCLNREFHLCDLDFSDLRSDSEDNIFSAASNVGGIPPPPPPGMMLPVIGVPPPPPVTFPTKYNVPAPPPKPSLSAELSNDSDSSTIKKNKKTVKLFWREIQEYPVPVTMRTKIGGFIWDDLPEVSLDTKMLEHLFESRTNDLIIKKLMEPKRNLILNAKRSNAINIAMKKLPTPQTIKAAIMKMDATVIGREGIEKLLTMLPTEEEMVKIQEAQYANPDLPLGSAEQFLLALASINELSSRLKLWVFKLDFDNLEKEIAEPLMDLKQGIELLKVNRTFKIILSTLRSVGSFLNGSQVKGFRLEYLSKVTEVKDTVNKHPLLYHICEMIIEKFPDSSDFFSEVGPVIRASKVDFDILVVNLSKLESDCKASWDHMKRIAKHDSSQIFKTKINDFLTDAAERIILLTFIKDRVMSRYQKFLLYIGVPPSDVAKTKPSEFLKVIAEFALEYRTSRERVLQQFEKKANHRERNKTRGKMIIDVGNYSHKNGDNTADRALKDLLKTDPDTGSLTKGRRKSYQPVPPKRILVNGELSADDEIIESLVRSATSKPKSVARERRKNRLSDQKNLNRTLDGSQSSPVRENK